MKKFMATYMGRADKEGQTMPPPEVIQKGMQAWHEWMATHAASIVYAGGPLGKTLRVDKSGIAKHKNLLTGFVIVQAESHEVAAAMFEKHPHFAIFPGDSVEVMECPPIPGA